MKKALVALIAFLFSANAAFAEGVVVQMFDVNVTVDPVFEMGIWMTENTYKTGGDQCKAGASPIIESTATATAMNFGSLKDPCNSGVLSSNKGYEVYFKAATSGQKYKIQQSAVKTGTAVDNALLMTPFFSSAVSMDVNPAKDVVELKTNAQLGYTSLPAGATLAPAQLAIGNGNTIAVYTSSTTADAPIIGVAYGFFDGSPTKLATINKTNGTPAALIKGQAAASVAFTVITYSITPA
jgi:hypothetical protein